MKFNRAWRNAGLFGAAQLIGLCRRNAAELLRIQTAKLYLKSAEVLRDLFRYQIVLLVCTGFLTAGAVMMQGAVLFYFPLEARTRAGLAVFFGALDFFVSLALLCWFSSASPWVKLAAKHNECLEEMLEEEPETARNGFSGPRRYRSKVAL